MRKVFGVIPKAPLVRRPGTQPIDWRGVPRQFHNRVSAVVHDSREAEDLGKFFGTLDFIPSVPIMLLLPMKPTVLGGAADPMDVRQLRDAAMAAFERELATLKKSGGGGLVMRERGGPLSAEAVQKQIPGAIIRQHVEEHGGI